MLCENNSNNLLGRSGAADTKKDDPIVAILDYGLGNVGSISNMLKRVGVNSILAQNEADLTDVSHLIIPGVGKFDEGMSSLNSSGLREVLEKKVLEDQVPVMGICLGMQMMTDGSEEGGLAGLGWIKGEVKEFKFEEYLRVPVPNMGWGKVKAVKENNITDSLEPDSRFYFVHSYYVECDFQSDVMLESNYEGKKFTSGFCKNNIYGVQFHPEKSHFFGMKMLEDFCAIDAF